MAYTEQAKTALAQAKRIAKTTGQNYIGTEHILLALIEESDCVGARILESRGVSISDLKSDIMNYLGSFQELGASQSIQTRNKTEKKRSQIVCTGSQS